MTESFIPITSEEILLGIGAMVSSVAVVYFQYCVCVRKRVYRCLNVYAIVRASA